LGPSSVPLQSEGLTFACLRSNENITQTKVPAFRMFEAVPTSANPPAHRVTLCAKQLHHDIGVRKQQVSNRDRTGVNPDLSRSPKPEHTTCANAPSTTSRVYILSWWSQSVVFHRPDLPLDLCLQLQYCAMMRRLRFAGTANSIARTLLCARPYDNPDLTTTQTLRQPRPYDNPDLTTTQTSIA
jgi:hypothetical protein